MAKKWRCTVCGYIHEGPEAPEQCPLCKAGKDKFVEVVEEEGNLDFVTVHKIGDGKGASKELWEGLQNHFMGECTEVGMYLAMSRQADREGYPEIAEAYKRYAWEEAEHASKFAELIGEVVWDTKTNLYKRMNAECGACEDIVPYRIVPGYPDKFTSSSGTWYQYMEAGQWVRYARITGGTLTVERPDGRYRITAEFTDCAAPAHRITCLWEN